MADHQTDHQTDPSNGATIPRYRLALVHEPDSDYADPELAAVPDPLAAGKLAAAVCQGEPFELLGVLWLTTSSRPIGHAIVSRGGLGSATVEPRMVFAPALLANAASVIMFHNHPSGSAVFSQTDRATTQRMAAAGEILGVRLLDHLLIADGRAVSLRQHEPELFAAGFLGR